MSSVNSNIKYRPDIDGLRALAILPVVIYHAFPRYAPGGFVGVDIFFVISGFLISLIIFKGLINNNFSFTEFYTHRVKRIFPALILVVSTCYVIGWFSLLPDEFKQLGKHIAAGMGFIQNFVLWKEAGYFDFATELKPLMHLWSLAVEEQFYLIFPLLLWILWKSRVNVLTSLLLLCLISFVLNIKGINKDPSKTFFLPQTRFWELMMGSVIAYFYAFNAWRPSFSKYLNLSVFNNIVFREVPEEKDRKLILSSILSFIGLLLILYAVAAYNHTMPYPGKKAVIPVLGASLLIIAGPHAWVNRHLLSNKFAIWIGLISYPLYLWHWSLLSFARIVESETPSREIRIAAVVISFILAALTYYLIEKRVRYGRSTWKKVTVLTLLAVMIGYVGYNTYHRDGLKFRENIKSLNAINSQFVGALWEYTKNDICQRKYPLPGSEKYGWWFCMSSSEEKPTLLLLGNSYANHFYPGIANNNKLNHHSILSIGTCGAEWVNESKLNSDVNFSPCSGYRSLDQQNLINGLIASEKSIKFVIIGGLSKNPNEDYVSRLKRRIDFLESNGARVILFVPHVRIDYDIKGCYSRPLKSPIKDCLIPAKVHKDLINSFSPVVESLGKTNPRVLVFDQNITFCNNEFCNFKLPTMPAFRDEYAHLSSFASEKVFDDFIEWAKINVPEILNQQ